MIIYETDTEEVRERIRRDNEIEMAKEHERGALLLPTGIPKRCKVDQPGGEERPISYKLGTGGYPVGNGDTRNVYYDGSQKKYIACGFAGRAKNVNTGFDKSGEMEIVRET